MSAARDRRPVVEFALGAICLCILCAIVIAGLWPFNPFPPNDVTWLENRNGLRFGRTGIALSSTNFQWPDSTGAATVTLEVWLRPDRNRGVNNIVTFYSPEVPRRFRLFHWRDSILLIYRDVGSQHQEIEIDDVFQPGIPLLITVTAGSGGAAVYLNGVLKQTSPHVTLSRSDVSGQIVLGTSPLAAEPWAGELRGLAIYSQELTGLQVRRHFDDWSGGGHPAAEAGEGPIALYTFSERAGTVVHDQMGKAPGLSIPQSFAIPHKSLLQAPWKDFRRDWNTLRDITINIAGFVVFGFFFCACLMLNLHAKRAVLATIILGAAISLAIESLQVFLPTRTSSMRDVALNTFGTVLGVLLCSLAMVRAFIAAQRAHRGLPPDLSNPNV